MTLLSALATIFGIIMGFANFPQIYKTKSAKDIAISTYLLLSLGSVI
jgi:uncharacterized protein with PQ loop repeat